MEVHDFYMKKALDLAEAAGEKAEVPVGALLVRDGEIIAGSHNLREGLNRPTAHAELLAIETAADKLGSWRLSGVDLYVTLEPCLMCWGAILLARIPRVIYGAPDPKGGVCGSLLSLHQETRFNHQPEVISGVLAQECGEVLSKFFENLREGKRDPLTKHP